MNEGVRDIQTVASQLMNMHAGHVESQKIIHCYI